MRERSGSLGLITRIVASYDSWIIRVYCRVRFVILRQGFLEEIGQYLPRNGRILDLGCGFGLFSLYFAALEPDRRIVGVDRNGARIEHARSSANRLRLDNVEYRISEVTAWDSTARFDAVYMLDLLHHLPREVVPHFLATLRGYLASGGILIVKDVEDRPLFKRWFTLVLDRLMVGMEPIHYWSATDVVSVLRNLGFEVFKHRMKDLLPYPHLLYVCRLQGSGDRQVSPPAQSTTAA